MASIKELPVKVNVARKQYDKPRLERVSLILDDTILFTACKTPSSIGPLQAVCLPGGLDDPCKDNAS